MNERAELDDAGQARAYLAELASARGISLATISAGFEERYGIGVGSADASQVREFIAQIEDGRL